MTKAQELINKVIHYGQACERLGALDAASEGYDHRVGLVERKAEELEEEIIDMINEVCGDGH